MGSGMTAVYAGTFDPMTRGHEDVAVRAVNMFDRVVVAVGSNSAKKTLFSTKDRVALASKCLDAAMDSRLRRRVTVMEFDGLLVRFCEEVGAKVMVRGIRAMTDFEYELTLAHANADQAPDVDTMFLPTRLGLTAVSSSLVKEIAKHRGNVSRYVSPVVKDALWAAIHGEASP